MALDTVGDFVARARTLLQDVVAPYRYADDEMIAALNEACMEAKRIRPDLFLRTFGLTIPTFTASVNTVAGKIPQEFAPSFVYYIVGNMQLRDEEDTQDARATIFLNKFVAQLMTLPS